MLVLGRTLNEAFTCRVGGIEIRVVVAGIRRDKVRLGIEAPPEVEIHRDEVWERIEKERA